MAASNNEVEMVTISNKELLREVLGHLLLGERGTEDILGQALPSVTVATLDLDPM